MAPKSKNLRLEESCRALWNGFDPIGVSKGPRDDEYDSYLPQTLKLLEAGADAYKFATHIRHCITINMGLSSIPDEDIRAFANELVALSRPLRKTADI